MMSNSKSRVVTYSQLEVRIDVLYMKVGGRRSKIHVHVDPICDVPEVHESSC
jgi:hypothetical protein